MVSKIVSLRIAFTGLAIVVVSSVTLKADNWPQWRGEKLDSISSDANVPGELSQDIQRWRVPLPGPAGASPVVWGERVFLTTTEGTEDGADLFLMCVGTDGNVQWKEPLEGENQNSRDNANSASPSPVTDGKYVWAMMGNGALHCFTVDGERVWMKNLQAEYGEFEIQFGMTSSPIWDNGRLYLALIHGDMKNQEITSVGHIVALDAATGDQIWYHQRLTEGVSESKHSYASPTIYRDPEREFLITHGGDYVVGHSLKDGSEIWRCGGVNPPGPSHDPFFRFIASPACVPGMIVVPTAKRGPVLALKPDLTGDVTDNPDSFLWRLTGGTPDVATPVIYEGLVYFADEKGILVCLDADSGQILYQQRLFASNHRSTPVAAGGKLYITGRDGQVFVVKAGREYQLISKIDLGEETTASAAIADDIVYVRTFEALYAFGK